MEKNYNLALSQLKKIYNYYLARTLKAEKFLASKEIEDCFKEIEIGIGENKRTTSAINLYNEINLSKHLIQEEIEIVLKRTLTSEEESRGFKNVEC